MRSRLYTPSEQQHSPDSATSTLVVLVAQQQDKYNTWYYTGIAVNPRSGAPVTISGIRGPANALAEPTLTRRRAYIQRSGRSIWDVMQLLPFEVLEAEENPDVYINIWY